MSFQQLPPFQVCIQSTDMSVRDALNRIKTALTPLDLDVEEHGTVELVLAEVLNNIVEHAYPAAESEGPIAISCRHERDGLHLDISDQGEPMPDGQTPLGNPPAVDVDFSDLPEGGFGWFLIKDLAKDVTYTRTGNQNHLNLRLAVGVVS